MSKNNPSIGDQNKAAAEVCVESRNALRAMDRATQAAELMLKTSSTEAEKIEARDLLKRLATEKAKATAMLAKFSALKSH